MKEPQLNHIPRTEGYMNEHKPITELTLIEHKFQQIPRINSNNLTITQTQITKSGKYNLNPT